jgi:hypothetical protein
MSELGKRRWAVISEHGCESSGLTYDEAHALLLRLTSEKVHGLSIVTDEAARHFLREGSAAPLPRKTATKRGQAR